MKPSLYVETSVVSYLAAAPSRDLLAAARQQLTHAWWSQKRDDFDCFVSELVLEEARRGDKDYAARRLELVAGFPVLPVTRAAEDLAQALLVGGGLPAKAGADAVHIAVATANGMDYLVTWNCKHIANAFIQRTIRRVCDEAGYETPIICTPEELAGEDE